MKAEYTPLTFNSFFAGIGGFDLALEMEGFKPLLHCEINPFCQQVLKKHWPDVPLETNITKLEGATIPQADVWCGGFPCQDVSVARGSKGRDGLKGKNSGLFYPFAKLIGENKPKALLIENVLGLLSSHNGQDFRIVLETLTDNGYSVAWRVMNSRYFGAPQSRPRVFICAILEGYGLPTDVLYELDKGARPKGKRAGFLTEYECKTTGARVPEVAYCLAATSGRHTGTDWSRTYVSYESAVRRLTPAECEGVQGFPKDWTAVSCPVTLKDNDLDTPRYQALGNAVAVPVIKWIASRLKETLLNKEIIISPSLASIQRRSKDFDDKSIRHLKLSELHLSTDASSQALKWQSGGIVIGDDCWDIKAPEAPAIPIASKLIDVIERTYPSDKYFLSKNAAVGILRRVYSQNRTLFGPLQVALENMANAEKIKMVV